MDPHAYTAAAVDFYIRVLTRVLFAILAFAGMLAFYYGVFLWVRLTLWVLDTTGSPEAALAVFISPAFIQAGVVGLLVYRHEIKKEQ